PPPPPRTGARRPASEAPPVDKDDEREARREDQTGDGGKESEQGDEDEGDDGESTKRAKPRRPSAKRAGPTEAGLEQLDEALSLAIGPRYGMRSLSYVDDRYDMNSNYALPRAPIVGVDADFFPAALSTRGVLSSFGM